MSFARFIHLLAHHPDFSREPEEIQQFTRYIDFFLDCLATPESVSFLYYLASRLKGVRDSESQGHSEVRDGLNRICPPGRTAERFLAHSLASQNLYMLSELAQHVIKTRAHAHNWNIETYPAKVQLPSDIFKPLPNREVQKEIYDRQYLSNEVIAMIGELSKPHKSPKVCYVVRK